MTAGRSSVLGSIALLLLDLPMVLCSVFRINNATADILELDVGDLDDMTADVTPQFLERLRTGKKHKPLNSSSSVDEMLSASSGGVSMLFVVMQWSWVLDHGLDGTNKLASDWATMLSLGLINEAVYAIDPGRIVLMIKESKNVSKVKRFILQQDNVDFVEVNTRFFYPDKRSQPLLSSKDRIALEVKAGYRPDTRHSDL